ncbi:Protein of unknown function [Pedobacter westerhofensis]|uniref:DUF3606 domain-containing protein n=1 Tax=Pedobacter westerhofensis TaxID=425512 RepID=A0A521FSG5_9SPHI|nr:DUF3606 domain-containing protein [Pedobacter westerhofensis]SMO99024.1 Protein of unknown function [Pedobacter westerhofensis]
MAATIARSQVAKILNWITWLKNWAVTRDQVRAAIKAVGNDRQDVEAYLKENK